MAKSKLPRSTPAARGAAAPPPKLATAAQHQQHPPTPPPMQQQSKQPVAGASTPPRSASPISNYDADTAAHSSAKKKKKKSKSKAKDSDLIDDHEYDLQSAAALGQRPRSPASLAARAQAQAQLLAAASELYRRIEGDAQGIPDDDAYWTSLPAHLRTFIRNALPLGQFPPAAQAALNDNANDPANRHASTQAMIAVAQQLAQAAHASQRHLQQYPPGTHPYPPLPFDASIFRREKEKARLDGEAQEKAKRDCKEARRKAKEDQQRLQREKVEKHRHLMVPDDDGKYDPHSMPFDASIFADSLICSLRGPRQQARSRCGG
ncbi:uncharacterized protein UTRI_05704 [Ustilago trichophora]|uniref:Uncharacterized protein n=1 Tax=Ustilago trichophora TaxID=86804 RepID=A0A5C3EJ45_9BASI|nr:uncharacterized protein UTRI_05704 [Ustilago trichophora]